MGVGEGRLRGNTGSRATEGGRSIGRGCLSKGLAAATHTVHTGARRPEQGRGLPTATQHVGGSGTGTGTEASKSLLQCLLSVSPLL